MGSSPPVFTLRQHELQPSTSLTSSRRKVEHGCAKSRKDAHARCQKSEKGVDFEKCQETDAEQISNISLECARPSYMDAKIDELQIQIGRMERNDEVMKSFAKALWTVLKQYKNKFEESEKEVRILKETLRHEINQVTELKQELKEVRSCCSCQKNSSSAGLSRSEINSPVVNARGTTLSSASPVNSKKIDRKVDNEITPEPVRQIEEISSASINCDALGLKSILLDAKLTGSSKSACTSLLERNSLIFERKKIADSSQGKEDPHEDTEALTNFDVSLTSIVNLIDSAKDDSYSLVSSSEPDFLLVGKSILTEEDNKLAGPITYSSPRKEDPHEDTKPLINFDVSFASNVNLIDSIENDSNSLVTSSGLDVSLMGKSTLTKGDDKDVVADTVYSCSYVKDNFMRQSNEVETLEEHKENPEDKEVIKDSQVEVLSGANLAEIQPPPLIHPSQSTVGEKDDEGILPSSEQESHTEQQQQQLQGLAAEKDKSETGKCDPTSKPVKSKKPRRRLLPASDMLLKEFSGIDMEDENTKENRGKPTAFGRGRSQGSISLVRLLKSNHV